MGVELADKCRGVGGCSIDAAVALVERVGVVLRVGTDAALFAPMAVPEGSGAAEAFRAVEVSLGGIDAEDRETPVAPAIVVRPISDRRVTESGAARRVVSLQVLIVMYCRVPADVSYGWQVWDRVSQDLVDMPWLGEGRYTVETDALECSEDTAISELFGAHVLSASVAVSMVVWGPTRGPEGTALEI